MTDHLALRPVYYPTLAGGMRRLVAPRTLSPQTPPHFFRNMQNLVAQDGILRRREALVDPSFGFTFNLNTTVNGQYPVAIFDLTLWPTTTGIRLLHVTDKELWISTSSAPATNITPTYTGTLTAANLSANVTNATGWQTNHVGDKNLIQIEGNWYLLNTVTSDTAGTISPVLSTAGGAGLAYTIRRSFYGLKDPTARWAWHGAHARIVLNDVYVAGMFGRYYDGVSAFHVTGAVLKIAGAADPTKTTFTPADVTYVFSSEDMDGGGSMDTANMFFAPLGLEVGEDGRLVMLAHHGADGGGGVAGSARAWWTSPTSYTTWIVSPGGFADQQQRFTKMTAMGRMGRNITLHFDDQVLLASPTGAVNPPLAYLPSRATVGAAGPRLLVPVPGGERCPAGEFFVALDGGTYVFNGDNSIPVDTGWRDVLQDYELRPYTQQTIGHGFVGFDTVRREVSMFLPDSSSVGTSTPYTTATLELRWHIDTGAMSRHRYGVPITAMANHNYNVNTLSTSPLANGTRIVGLPSYGNSLASAMIYTLSQQRLADHSGVLSAPVLVSGETPGGCFLELDDQDWGMPENRSIILWIVVWVVGRATTTETLKVRISRDDGANYEDITASVSLTSGVEQAVSFRPAHTYGPGIKWRIRIASDGNDTFSFALRGAKVWAIPVTDERAA